MSFLSKLRAFFGSSTPAETKKYQSSTSKCCWCGAPVTDSEDEGWIDVRLSLEGYTATKTERHHVDCFLASLEGCEYFGHPIITCVWQKPRKLPTITEGEGE